MLVSIIASLAVTSTSHARLFDGDGRIFDGDGKIIGGDGRIVGAPTGGGRCKGVSEPAAALVGLTALGLFVAARRRQSV